MKLYRLTLVYGLLFALTNLSVAQETDPLDDLESINPSGIANNAKIVSKSPVEIPEEEAMRDPQEDQRMREKALAGLTQETVNEFPSTSKQPRFIVQLDDKEKFQESLKQINGLSKEQRDTFENSNQQEIAAALAKAANLSPETKSFEVLAPRGETQFISVGTTANQGLLTKDVYKAAHDLLASSNALQRAPTPRAEREVQYTSALNLLAPLGSEAPLAAQDIQASTNSFAQMAADFLGLHATNKNALANNPIVEKAPKDLQSFVRTNFEKLLTDAPTQTKLASLVDLAKEERFQILAEQNIGTQGAEDFNNAVIGAKLSSDEKTGANRMAKLADVMAKEAGFAPTLPTTLAFKLAGSGPSINTEYGPIPSSLSELINPKGESGGVGGGAVNSLGPLSQTWVDLAFELGKNPSALKYSMSRKDNDLGFTEKFQSGLKELQTLMLSLKELGGLDLLNLIEMPKGFVNPEKLDLAQQKLSQAMGSRPLIRLHPQINVVQSFQMLKLILDRTIKSPLFLKATAADQKLFSELTNLLKKTRDDLNHVKGAREALALSKALLRDTIYAKAFKIYHPRHELSFRRTTSLLEFSYKIKDVSDKKSAFRHMLYVTAHQFERSQIMKQLQPFQQRLPATALKAVPNKNASPNKTPSPKTVNGL